MSEGRRWDEYDAYLFDIDGTLLNCSDAVHYFAFCDTLSMIAGRPLNLDGVTAHGNTDVGIMRDALVLAGVEESAWRPRLKEAREALCGLVARQEEKVCATMLPGVRETLAWLRERGAVLGVATGNLEEIGRIKLRRCGLLEWFEFGGYSDEFEFRSDMIRGALQKARALAGENAAVCVVGDTPADVRAAKANGLDVIAVGTGVYTIEELRAEEPTFCVGSLLELVSGVAARD